MAVEAALVESGRRIVSAARLGGDANAPDLKWQLGDLLVEAGQLDDDDLSELADLIGYGLNRNSLRSYREVAAAWPPASRVEASWTTHRTLAKLQDRFQLIKPDMTLRQAQEVAGKRPSDVEHPDRWTFERRVAFVITKLQDAATNEAVREEVEGRKRARAVRTAARAVQEDLSAEYREALREMRDRNNAKTPERAALDAIFKLRDAREYVRAVAKAGTDERSFVPDHRKPDVVVAIRDLAVGAIEALYSLGLEDSSDTMDALVHVAGYLEAFHRAKVSSGFSGVVIDA